MAFEDDDANAEIQAQEARAEGVRIIESHLSSHLTQNPGCDYVSWIATLHPENAEVQIDERFFVSGNPWWNVYEASKPHLVLPTVVDGVATTHHEDSCEAEDNHNASHQSPHQQGCFCNPIGFVIGLSLTFSSILAVFLLEIGALAVYFVAAVPYHLSTACKPPANPISGIFFSFFMLLYWVFALADSLLLLISVLVSELLALIACMLGCLCGGCGGAKVWHQSVRKSCHALRITFRKPFKSPSRTFMLCCGDRDENENERDVSPRNSTTAIVVSAPDRRRAASPTISSPQPTIAVLVDPLGNPPVNPDYDPPTSKEYSYTNKK